MRKYIVLLYSLLFLGIADCISQKKPLDMEAYKLWRRVEGQQMSEDGNYFMATATVSTQGQNTPILQQYMKADVRIIVSNKTLWQQVFG